MKNLALRGFVPDPKDPTAPEKEEQLKKARRKELDENSTSTVAGPSSSNEHKRKSDSDPKAKSAKRAKKEESTEPIAKEDKGQINDRYLKRELRAKDSEELVQSHLAQITRLEGKEDLMKKAYGELKKKSDKKLEGYGDLRDLKLTTFNHFMATWEIKNEDKEGEENSDLKNAFPLEIRKYLSQEIKANKDSLK